MGRTKRIRINRKYSGRTDKQHNIELDDNVINLQKWLKRNDWRNETKLRLRYFPETGRGLTSSKPVRINNTLISMPYDLMITFTTIQTYFAANNLTLDEKLTMQEFLTLFLMLERTNKTSPWTPYINCLPYELPDLPWMKRPEEIHLYPQDLQIASRKNLENFKTSRKRVGKSIRKHLDCVSYELLFKWAFVLVNTRAVYVDPNLVWSINNSLRTSLLDEPSQALCPFLDMFNHHSEANTEAKLVRIQNSLTYELKTLTGYKAHEQIFISYGPHDNNVLLMQYGFFINGNPFEVVKFQFEEVREMLQLDFNTKKYKFIMDHSFDNDLYVGYSGVSFNLKALLYVGQTDSLKKCSVDIFSDSYPELFENVAKIYLNVLLKSKLELSKSDLLRYVENTRTTCSEEEEDLLQCYLKYRINFVSELLNKQ